MGRSRVPTLQTNRVRPRIAPDQTRGNLTPKSVLPCRQSELPCWGVETQSGAPSTKLHHTSDTVPMPCPALPTSQHPRISCCAGRAHHTLNASILAAPAPLEVWLCCPCVPQDDQGRAV